MCFYLETKKQKAKIAKTDIKCWKCLKIDNSPRFGGSDGTWTHRSITPYVVGKNAPRINIKPGFFSIRSGYHSCKEKEEAEGYQAVSFLTVIRKFIIPKGTRYYENETEYVSETIMLVG